MNSRSLTISAVLGGAALATCLSLPAMAQPAGLGGVVAAGVEAQLVSDQFDNTEGPLPDGQGGLYFSDTNASRTYHLDAAGKIVVWRENTNRGNGIAMRKDGRLAWAEEPRITQQNNNGIVIRTQGFRLFQPNDLIFDTKNGLYFTDPGPRPVVKGLKYNVYYLPQGSREPKVIDDGVARPNGITLSNNGKMLFVDDTVGTLAYAYDVQPDGSVKNKRPWAGLRDIPQGQEGFADGMAIDRNDRLYIATLTGVQVFDNKGAYMGTIKVPRQPSNVAFSGPDKKVLFITARQALYRIQMMAQGPDRPGK